MSDPSPEGALPACVSGSRKRGQRNKRKREKLRNMSKSEKRKYFADKASERAQKEYHEELEVTKQKAKEQRKMTLAFWHQWKAKVYKRKDVESQQKRLVLL